MALPHSKDLDQDHVLALLAAAEGYIRADRLDEAALKYQQVLEDPALDQLPTARSEVFANYGALLLHQVRQRQPGPDSDSALALAIDMLSRARMGYRLGQGEGSGIVTDTNLALAYFQLHLSSGENAALMSAHFALDGAEKATATDDQDMLAWIRSIRTMLLARIDRRRDPR